MIQSGLKALGSPAALEQLVTKPLVEVIAVVHIAYNNTHSHIETAVIGWYIAIKQESLN